ncbi:hypothetical protein BD779DRAFT_1529522 [Infundibulicybe gibba]|nr:hypothetical protein BD779DRAFT_1529522 [Infundibulicybe gibba]
MRVRHLIAYGFTALLHIDAPPCCVRVYCFVACRCTVVFHMSVPFCRVQVACVSGSSALGDVGIAYACAAPILRGPRPLLCHLTCCVYQYIARTCRERGITDSVATGPALVWVGTCYSPLIPRSIIPRASRPRPFYPTTRAGEALGLGCVMVSVGVLKLTEPRRICVAKGGKKERNYSGGRVETVIACSPSGG